MQTEVIYLFIGIVVGGIAAWVIATMKVKSTTVTKADYNALTDKQNLLNTEIGVEKDRNKTLTNTLAVTDDSLKKQVEENTKNTGLVASLTTGNSNLIAECDKLKNELELSNNLLREKQTFIQNLEKYQSASDANLKVASETIEKNTEEIKLHKAKIESKSEEFNEVNKKVSEVTAKNESLNDTVTEQKRIYARLEEELAQLKTNLNAKTDEFNKSSQVVAELTAINKSLNDKILTQKDEMLEMQRTSQLQFEKIANQILEEKSGKFTETNKTNIEALLGPLGKDIEKFKTKVEEIYDKESKERFSLGKEVEKLVQANQRISEEANNLTNALTSNSKSQGDWGQMILESILEKSGLAKDREYFVQEYLKDEHGNYLVNELGNKMQPDVTISYPDNRKVIVDSKVSLTAYTRYIAATDKGVESMSLSEHLKSLRKHIDDLSSKNYQDFAPALDFVMMFVPVEPAYLIAIHSDMDLWAYAYKKRILLTSPTNLIVALKMIADLWKRDKQSKNYQEIVERGGKLYDKVFNVLASLKDIGDDLKSAHKNYNITINRLSEGNDNVLAQIEKLKVLGANAKKTLPNLDSLAMLNIPGDNLEKTHVDLN